MKKSNHHFATWFDGLEVTAAAKVSTALARMGEGTCTNTRSDFDPGHLSISARMESIVILIGGGTKKRQQNDIAAAQAYWADYKQRKKRETDTSYP